MKISLTSKRPESYGQTVYQTETIDKTLIMGKLAIIIDTIRTATDVSIEKWDITRPDSFMQDWEETIEIKLKLTHQGLCSMAKTE